MRGQSQLAGGHTTRAGRVPATRRRAGRRRLAAILLGILGLRARDVVGFTVVQFLVHAPIVLFLLWLLGLTLPYSPPVMP